jgi:ribosomal protein L12E/L44/L45/RPP1/RPP2
MAAKTGDDDDAGDRKSALPKSVDYDITKAILDSISTTTEAILLSEFEKFLNNEDFMRATRNKPMAYLSAIAVLSLALKDESKENISKAMEAVGLDFDGDVFDKLPKIYLHNHLVYVYAFYFLMINGKETSGSNIRSVVEAIGMAFDRKTFEESLEFICANTKCGPITF